MPEALSIRERIMCEVCATLAGITGVRRIVRVDKRGQEASYDPDTGERDILVTEAADVPAENMQDVFERELHVIVEVPLEHGDGEEVNTAFMHNRWVALIEQALMGNAMLTESAAGADGKDLSTTGLTIEETSVPAVDENYAGWASVVCVIPYRTDVSSPYTYSNVYTEYKPAVLPAYCKYPFA